MADESFVLRGQTYQSDVPPDGAVVQDGPSWQVVRQVLSDAGLTPQIGDWVFGDLDFEVSTPGSGLAEPGEELTQRFMQWGIHPGKAYAVTEAMAAAGVTIAMPVVEPPGE